MNPENTSAPRARALTALTRGLVLVGLALAACAAPAWASNTEIAGVRYDATAKVEGQALVLNGSGLSYKALQKVYTVGLYTAQRASSTDGILSMPGPKELKFVMLVHMRVDELGKLIARGIEQNTSRDEFMRLIPSMIDMGRVFSKMRRMSPGDTISVEWVPHRGTVFFVNGQPTGMPITEPDFFNAVLKVWIGKNPTTQDLKDALLDFKAPPLLNALE